ncbi:hypothetical protein A9K97_gp460 [Tokyovirus A1]|uniref:hypothetical protein n=1 Tax=Tokyovirus A1 TaxID=1826170 RepID=UPI0007A9753E|nr:hypothetical protein A9K97_gp460 [Tokyovirus A1]BAU79891.1 hypothetical protein [Tokyovirus A1]
MEATVSNFLDSLEDNTDKRIVLLREKKVLQWIFGDLSFLPPVEKKTIKQYTQKLKKYEDSWGRKILAKKRPDLKLKGQWSGPFGEALCEEMCVLLGKRPKRPQKKEGKAPDVETEEEIFEVKTQTYMTTGTASQKILSVPFLYCEVPELYGKPLKILCIGGAERLCRESYGVFCDKACEKKKKILAFYNEMGVEFVAFSEIVQNYLSTE